MTPEPSQDSVADFASACEQFLFLCVEDPRPEIERLWSLRSALAALVAGVAQLPVSWGPYDFNDRPTYDEVRARVAPRHPSLSYYHDVLNVLDVKADPETAIGDTIDDLVDTYRELLCGLEHLRAGRREEAVGHWLNGFYSHWGNHAVGALRAIHAHVQDSGWLPPERRDDRKELKDG